MFIRRLHNEGHKVLDHRIKCQYAKQRTRDTSHWKIPADRNIPVFVYRILQTEKNHYRTLTIFTLPVKVTTIEKSISGVYHEWRIP
jgi:hypothetical protein